MKFPNRGTTDEKRGAPLIIVARVRMTKEKSAMIILRFRKVWFAVVTKGYGGGSRLGAFFAVGGTPPLPL